VANGVNELIDMLYNMVSDAWGLPIGAERCVIERDKVLDLLDEIKAQLPSELAEAKRLINARADFIANARKEAETIKEEATQQAKQMVEEQNIVKQAKARGNEIIAQAETRSGELRRAANDYADDALRRTESAISEALNEVHQSRLKFRSAAASPDAPEESAQ
jgi:cell division septum initiation protein DivIVA